MTDTSTVTAPADAVEIPLLKLYLVTHANLSVGYQIAQVSHAMTEFIFRFPQEARKWYEESNTVVSLEARDTHELHSLIEAAQEQGIGSAPFYEPDLGDELTAVAFCPAPEVSEMLSSFPLAGILLGNQKEKRAREAAARNPEPPEPLFSL